MSRINELIAEMCPDGVEYRPVGLLTQLRNGYTPSKSNLEFWSNGDVPWFRMEDIRRGGRILSDSIQKVARAAVKGGRLFPENSILMSTLATIGEHALIRVPHLANQQLTSMVIRQEYEKKLEPKFLFYCCFQLADWCKKNTNTASLAAVDMKAFAQQPIPLPPLPIQQEIVNILDTFSKLEAELGAELEARQRQYEYYRDELLTFDARVTTTPFGALAKVVRGASPRPIQRYLVESSKGVPWIKIGDVPSDGKYITGTAQYVSPAGALMSRVVRPGDFLLSNSMSFGRPYISKIEGCIHDGWLAISDFSDTFTPDFLYHLLRSKPVQLEFSQRAGGGTVQNLNADIVKSILLPTPSLDEQMHIASVLDAFELLVNDLSSGLPAEIAARRQQYEHYRDRLLTFKEKTE